MAQPTFIRVLTLDSLPLVHCGVREMLSAYADIQLVGEAYDLAEALHLVTCRTPDLALVEIADLGPAWLEAMRCLVRSAAHQRIVVFTSVADPQLAREALCAGAQGVLLKNLQAMNLAQALRSVAAGQQVFAPEVIHTILATQADDLLVPNELSSREREILVLIARGLRNHEIAERLCVSQSTIKFHCSNIFIKLGVTNRAQAIAKAYAQRLLPSALTGGAQVTVSRGVPGRAALARSA